MQLLLLREHQLGMGRQQGVQRGGATLLNTEAKKIWKPALAHHDRTPTPIQHSF